MLKIAYGMAGLFAHTCARCLRHVRECAGHRPQGYLSSAMATTMAMTAIETCTGQGNSVSVHVVGREGQVILGLRNELAGPATFENSMKKAYTARTFRTPSGKFADGVKGNPSAGALFLTNIVPAQGALPILVGDDVIGAIGVSGAPGGDKDEACAKTGIEKVSADLK